MERRIRNPRGSSGVDALAYYLVAGGLTVLGYRMALDGKLGNDFKKGATDIWETLHPGKQYPGSAGGSGSSGKSQPVQPRDAPMSGPYQGVAGMKGQVVTLNLKDFDGVPVAYSVDRDTIIQNVQGGNVYQVGDVFFDNYGNQYQYVGSGQLVELSSRAQFPVRDFVPS